jgi:hypothetical protein
MDVPMTDPSDPTAPSASGPGAPDQPADLPADGAGAPPDIPSAVPAGEVAGSAPGGRWRGRRSVRRGVVGAAVGALIAVVALAGLAGSDDDGDARSGRRPPGGTAPAGEVTHQYPGDHVGPVWIEVTSPPDTPSVVTIVWGPWQRTVHHRGGSATYEFLQNADPAGVTPLTVRSAPSTDVVFGYGPEAPAGAIDVNDGWDPAG